MFGSGGSGELVSFGFGPMDQLSAMLYFFVPRLFSFGDGCELLVETVVTTLAPCPLEVGSSRGLLRPAGGSSAASHLLALSRLDLCSLPSTSFGFFIVSRLRRLGFRSLGGWSMKSTNSSRVIPRDLATAAKPELSVGAVEAVGLAGRFVAIGRGAGSASSSELSSSSVESPSFAPWRRGIPRTGDSVCETVPSSSLESAKRLRNARGLLPSPSSSESPNRDLSMALGFVALLGDLPVEKNVFPLRPLLRSVVRILGDPDETGRCLPPVGEAEPLEGDPRRL